MDIGKVSGKQKSIGTHCQLLLTSVYNFVMEVSWNSRIVLDI